MNMKGQIMEVEKAWQELVDSVGTIEGKTLGMWRGGLIVAHLSLIGSPELVVQLGQWQMPQGRHVGSNLKIQGLEVKREMLRVGHLDSPCLVLRSKDAEIPEMFFALARHLLVALPKLDPAKAAPEDIEAIIRIWVRFWSKTNGSSDKKMLLGLLGELLAIDRWLDLDSFELQHWLGPKGGPHDFCGATKDIEVKLTSNRTGPLTHEISSIQQLEIQSGKSLKVLSFRANISKTGAESLHGLVQRVSELPVFQTLDGREWLEGALDNGGYSPELDETLSNYDLWSEALYAVRQDFPRITAESLPEDVRIFDVRYSVNFGGCQEYLEFASPTQINLTN